MVRSAGSSSRLGPERKKPCSWRRSAVALHRASQCDDGVGAIDGPSHATVLEAGADDVLAAPFDHAAGHAQAHRLALRIVHAVAVAGEVLGVLPGLLGRLGRAVQGGDTSSMRPSSSSSRRFLAQRSPISLPMPQMALGVEAVPDTLERRLVAVHQAGDRAPGGSVGGSPVGTARRSGRRSRLRALGEPCHEPARRCVGLSRAAFVGDDGRLPDPPAGRAVRAAAQGERELRPPVGSARQTPLGARTYRHGIEREGARRTQTPASRARRRPRPCPRGTGPRPGTHRARPRELPGTLP